MSNITLSLTVTDSSIIVDYDTIKVYRSKWGPSGEYVEASTPATRIPMLDDETRYEFIDTYGDAAFYYKTSYWNSGTGAESEKSEAFKGDLTGNYICVQDLREEGFNDVKLSDLRALALIQMYEDFVDKTTGQWFNPREATFQFDGAGGNLLQFPVPIIRVDGLYVNESPTPLPVNQYVVYNRKNPDDRQNPRIKLKNPVLQTLEGFYQMVGGSMAAQIFKRGQLNQTVEGLFGYTEQDGTAPLLIKYAVRKLIAFNYEKLGTGESIMIAGPVISETTDRHNIKYSEKMLQANTLTSDPDLDRILIKYRRPLIIDAPYGELV